MLRLSLFFSVMYDFMYRISSFKRRGVYLILGLLGAAFIRVRPLLESSVFRRAAFNSKIKIEENEIMCQFKTIRYFLNHVV